MNCELCTVRGVYRAWYRVNEVSAAMRVYSERCDVIPYPLYISSSFPLSTHKPSLWQPPLYDFILFNNMKNACAARQRRSREGSWTLELDGGGRSLGQYDF